MTKTSLVRTGLGFAAVGLVVLLLAPVSAEAEHPGQTKHGKSAEIKKTDKTDAHQGHVGDLDAALKSIDAAIKAVEAGHKEMALASLKEARGHVAASRQAKSKADQIVNARCPILGTKLVPDKVPANLTREYQGKKVGFCCAGCPEAWDKLSESEKLQKFHVSVATTNEASDKGGADQHKGHNR